MEKLQIKENMGKEEMRYAVEAARLLGFQTEAAVFPVTCTEGGILAPQNEDELQELWALSEKAHRRGICRRKAIRSRCLIWSFGNKRGWSTYSAKGRF